MSFDMGSDCGALGGEGWKQRSVTGLWRRLGKGSRKRSYGLSEDCGLGDCGQEYKDKGLRTKGCSYRRRR